MSRRGHYVKPAKRASVPSSVFALVCRPWHDSRTHVTGIDRMTWRSAEIAHCTRSRGKWSVASEFATDSQEELRAWMDSRALRRCTNWVIAPLAGDSLTLTGWWKYAESRGVVFRRENRASRDSGPDGPPTECVTVTQFVANEPPFILTYRADGLRWRWVSERNYWTDHCGVVRSVGDGSEGAGGIGSERRHDAGGTRCADALALASRFRGLCDWWLRTARAPLGLTAGQLATGILRSYVPPRTLCTHNDDDVHRLERSAAHGGRASVWFVGSVVGADHQRDNNRTSDSGCAHRTVPGPVHHLDVSSMYPWLLRDRLYPVKLGPVYGDIRPDALLSLCRGTGVIARVTISTDRGEYPYRMPTETVYPVGTFTTTLAAPDLLSLAEHGSIDRVHFVATYRLASPFKDSMDHLLSARARARAEGDEDAHALSKLVSVSLAGRLAMREGGWARAPLLDEPGRWGQEFGISNQTDSVSRFRWICGAAWRWDPDKIGRGPHTAAFAYLTAYGRQHMRGLRAHCPPRSVYSQCIDGLYCNGDAYRSLCELGSLTGTGAGTLRLTGTRDSAEFYGPRHYRWGDKWTLAGFHAATVDPETRTVSYSLRTPLFATRARSAPTEVYYTYRREGIPCQLERGKVGEDGWVIAPTVRSLRARRSR